ncbi:MAG: hypothetical protein EDS66_10790 [Planctomycetota bacterium]|nr:MAG: hypothetical protein EDS66_10790 [Planctomycetota bacterium]
MVSPIPSIDLRLRYAGDSDEFQRIVEGPPLSLTDQLGAAASLRPRRPADPPPGGWADSRAAPSRTSLI